MRVSVNVNKRKNVSRNNPYKGAKESSNSSPKTLFFIGLVIVVFASLFGFVNYLETEKTKDYIATVGYVVDYYDRWDSSEGDYTWKEIYEYKVDGKVYEITGSSYSTTPKPFGAMVNVYYNPDKPSVAVINKNSNAVIIYAVCGVLGGAGLIAIFVGIKGFFKGNE